MGRITTHVLDTAAGRPAAGLKVILTRLDGTPEGDRRSASPMRTGAPTSRCSKARPSRPGSYEITFHVGDYFRRTGAKLPDPPFLDVVPMRFGVTEDAHYHVPLLVSPFAYSTYRGS